MLTLVFGLTLFIFEMFIFQTCLQCSDSLHFYQNASHSQVRRSLHPQTVSTFHLYSNAPNTAIYKPPRLVMYDLAYLLDVAVREHIKGTKSTISSFGSHLGTTSALFTSFLLLLPLLLFILPLFSFFLRNGIFQFFDKSNSKIL